MAFTPVGPLSASTYWRRRAVLVAVVLVLLLVALHSCGGSRQQPDALVRNRSPSATPAPSLAVSPTATRAAVPTPSPTPAAVQPCGDAALAVSVVSDATQYAAGAAPRFTLTVRNTGPLACTRALGPGAVELRVLSGEDRIWSSSDCAGSTAQGVMTLPVGAGQALTLQWPGRRTTPGCHLGATALSGVYRVSARVGDLIVQGSVFRITG